MHSWRSNPKECRGAANLQSFPARSADSSSHSAVPCCVFVVLSKSRLLRMPTDSAVFPFSPQTLDIGILDIFGFEEFQKNEFEQVSRFSFQIFSNLVNVNVNWVYNLCFPLRYSNMGLKKDALSLTEVTISGGLILHHLSMVRVLRVMRFDALVKVPSCVWAHECCGGSEDGEQTHLKSGSSPRKA